MVEKEMIKNNEVSTPNNKKMGNVNPTDPISECFSDNEILSTKHDSLATPKKQILLKSCLFLQKSNGNFADTSATTSSKMTVKNLESCDTKSSPHNEDKSNLHGIKRKLSFSNSDEKEYAEPQKPLSVLGNLLGTEIPYHINQPPRIPVEEMEGHRMVGLGVETTSLDRINCDIIQLTCSDMGPEKGPDFNIYIKPEQNIDFYATQVNCITFDNGILRQNGNEVPVFSLEEGIRKLIEHLQYNTILISHNTKNFQSYILYRNALKVGLHDLLQEKVIGFCDSYPLFLDMYPGELKSYRLWNIINEFVYRFPDTRFEKRTGMQCNLKKIQNLITLLQLPVHKFQDVKERQKLYKHTVTMENHIKLMNHSDDTFRNEKTYSHMIENNKLSKKMAHKMASSGLTLEHLALAFEEGRSEGIFELLNPRITKNRIVISKIISYFSEIYS